MDAVLFVLGSAPFGAEDEVRFGFEPTDGRSEYGGRFALSAAPGPASLPAFMVIAPARIWQVPYVPQLERGDGPPR